MSAGARKRGIDRRRNRFALRVIGRARRIATRGAKMVQRIFLLFLLLACFSAGAALAQISAALDDSNMAADRAKSDALTPEQREQARSSFEQGFEDLRSGDYRAARLRFEQGLSIDPGNSLANLYIAETLARLGDDVRARRFYNRVVALDPGSAEARQAEAGVEDLDVARIDAANRMVLVVSVKAPFKTLAGYEMYVKSTKGVFAIYCVSITSASCLVAKEIMPNETNWTPMYKPDTPFSSNLDPSELEWKQPCPPCVYFSAAVLPLAPMLQSIRDGKLRAIAVTGATRSPNLPEVPTLAESGLSGF